MIITPIYLDSPFPFKDIYLGVVIFLETCRPVTSPHSIYSLSQGNPINTLITYQNPIYQYWIKKNFTKWV